MKITLFYTPVRDATEAESLGKQVLALRLAACANTFPIQSTYLWQGELQQEGEVVLLLKTTETKTVLLRTFLEEKHSYGTPAILSWEVEVNETYGQWVIESTI